MKTVTLECDDDYIIQVGPMPGGIVTVSGVQRIRKELIHKTSQIPTSGIGEKST